MQDPLIIVAGVVFLIATISFIIIVRPLFRFRKEEGQITEGEFDNPRDMRLLEELKARQDQDKTTLLEFFSERLGEISQKIDFRCLQAILKKEIF